LFHNWFQILHIVTYGLYTHTREVSSIGGISTYGTLETHIPPLNARSMPIKGAKFHELKCSKKLWALSTFHPCIQWLKNNGFFINNMNMTVKITWSFIHVHLGYKVHDVRLDNEAEARRLEFKTNNISVGPWFACLCAW